MKLPGIFRRKEAGNHEKQQRLSCGSVTVRGSLISKKKAFDALLGISAIEKVELDGGAVKGMIIESADRNKRPHLYIGLRFGQGAAVAEYSIPQEVPDPDARRISVIDTMLSLLSILEEEGAFKPSNQGVYELASDAIRLSGGYVGVDIQRLKAGLEQSTRESARLIEENGLLKEEKEGLGFQCMEMERKIQDYEERISSLERMTDSQLDSEILRWVEDHGGKLHDSGFCRAHSIGQARLEERLDALSKRGVIRIV